jgi:hypothetical protein
MMHGYFHHMYNPLHNENDHSTGKETEPAMYKQFNKYCSQATNTGVGL